MRVLKKLYLVVRRDGDLVLLCDKGEARSYCEHYDGKMYSFRWSKPDGQYGAARRRR